MSDGAATDPGKDSMSKELVQAIANGEHEIEALLRSGEPVDSERISWLRLGLQGPRSDLAIPLRHRLTELVFELGFDEMRVLILVAERLRVGQQHYGRFDLATDRRDFAHEALEEIADALVYAACGLMRRRR